MKLRLFSGRLSRVKATAPSNSCYCLVASWLKAREEVLWEVGKGKEVPSRQDVKAFFFFFGWGSPKEVLLILT